MSQAWSECSLGSAPARLLRLLRARVVALGGSTLGEASPLGVQPPPRVREPAASEADCARLWPSRRSGNGAPSKVLWGRSTRNKARPTCAWWENFALGDGQAPNANVFAVPYILTVGAGIVVDYPSTAAAGDHTLSLSPSPSPSPSLSPSPSPSPKPKPKPKPATLSLTLALTLTRRPHLPVSRQPRRAGEG